MKDNKMTLSDYYFKMSDYFNQIEPDRGEHLGSWFDFKEDAKEFVQLAKKEIEKEMKNEG